MFSMTKIEQKKRMPPEPNIIRKRNGMLMPFFDFMKFFGFLTRFSVGAVFCAPLEEKVGQCIICLPSVLSTTLDNPRTLPKPPSFS